VYLLDRTGVTSGLDLAQVTATAAWLEERLGKPLPGALVRAGGFPG
jgi:hydroxymethylglutaryl-CoA lyase